MMRFVMAVGVSLTVLAGSGWADEIYRSTDPAGRVTYTNTPTTGGTPSGLVNDEAPSAAPGADTGEGGEQAAAAAEDNGFSTEASLRRNAIEREARATDRRLRELDDHLASLARTRTARSGGEAATGGVVMLADAGRSDQERELERERAQVAKRAESIQGDYTKLRDEVAGRLGALPPWWVEIRTGRR